MLEVLENGLAATARPFFAEKAWIRAGRPRGPALLFHKHETPHGHDGSHARRGILGGTSDADFRHVRAVQLALEVHAL